MSMDRCSKCDALIDTDYFPEVYREDADNKCICDSCYNEGGEEERESEVAA